MSSLLWAIGLPFTLALLAPLLAWLVGRFIGWVLLPAPAILFLLLLRQWPLAQSGATWTVPWLTALGVDLTLRLDGLTLFFALLVTGIGALVVLYSIGYLAKERELGKFYSYLLGFMGAMLGVVLSDNLVLLFVFWELTSVTSFLLIGFWDRDSASRQGAQQALVITAAGGLAMLLGFVLLAAAGGSFEVRTLLAASQVLRAHPLYGPALLLVLLGAFTKSAQFPFHIWLPGAMAAPTPVSAYLHSATMVKAGVFLLAKLAPVLGGTPLWTYLVTVGGLVTLVVGAYLALMHADLKALLAYSTVSSLGLMVALLGLGGFAASEATLWYLLNHAAFKAALFMAAGSVDHATGTRDLERLGGLRRAMPLTAGLSLVAALSMAGLPPLGGFISKELFFASTQHAPGILATWGPVLAVLGGLLSFAYTAKFWLGTFAGRTRGPLDHEPHEAPSSMWLPALVLAVLAMPLGLVPGVLAETVVAPAAAVVAGVREELHLSLWHGLTPELAMSAVAVSLGLLLTLAWRQVVPLQQALGARPLVGRWYETLMAGALNLAKWLTHLSQNGSLASYARYSLLALGAVAAYVVFYRLPPVAVPRSLPAPALMVGLALVGMGGAATVVLARTRLLAVLALGAVGASVSTLFVLLSAPDLALTQLLVEVVTLVLFLLVFRRLPELGKVTGSLGDGLLTGLVGSAVAGVVLASGGGALFPKVADYFVQHSWPDGHGRNIVNVILVDFRGFDTLGEITVLAIAAVGVFALLARRGK
ncbi:MAG: DUF4040 domain-containing protein [Deinococcus sp.]|nr:DUF4040 domain-containing protein [Deinococcus sp.]